MYKFTCFVFYILYAVFTQAESDSSDSGSDEVFDKLSHECMEKFGVTEDDLNGVVKTSDVTNIDSCYWGCYFTKMGVLNDKGQFDMNNFQTTMKKMMKDDEDYDNLEKLVKKCEPVKDETVTDGEAGCERGTLFAVCFVKNDGDFI
ncbi:hypothetical protein PYW07_012218 [Mythimna separata]|uniref:Uncharacterized protein n=1 Tax=Mythimna separata TaxID=271217 RepID=A0AAD7YMX5_MYTSE|nr:hypothetical protein PYW07_012218 [Mythimna separata]